MNWTKHALERFTTRFPKLIEAGVSPVVCMFRVFKEAKPDNRFRNNTAYLVYLSEKYGDFDFEFLVNGDVAFICRGNTIVTVINRNRPLGHRHRNHLGEVKQGYKKRANA